MTDPTPGAWLWSLVARARGNRRCWLCRCCSLNGPCARTCCAPAEPGSLIERTASLLPADMPVIAVYARGLNTDQAAAAIAQALGRDASTASGCWRILDITPRTAPNRSVVVDAVDEAFSPATLLSSLLVPLARQPGMRIAVGARRHVLAEAGDADLTIDLDTDDYRDPQALSDYIYRLLIASEEPGVTTCLSPGRRTARWRLRTRPQRWRRDRATCDWARRGAESFLIGRLLALSARASAEPADISSHRLADRRLPASVAEAFDEDLARLGDNDASGASLADGAGLGQGPRPAVGERLVPVARALAEHIDDAAAADHR